jgi:hypothetical protein
LLHPALRVHIERKTWALLTPFASITQVLKPKGA